MVKKHDVCALCGGKKLLNFAGLCKRCNKRKAAGEIKGHAIEAQEEMHAELAKERLVEEEQAKEEAENTTEETSTKDASVGEKKE